MDVDEVIARCRRMHPGRPIIRLPADQPTEIICELTSAIEDPEHGACIAVIDRSAPHLHHRTREHYRILQGTARIWIDGRPRRSARGATVVIEPNQVHWVEGDAVWIRVDTWPAWTADDHILVEADGPVSP